MCVYVCVKFEVSSVILTSFTPAPSPLSPQNKPLKSPPRLGLKSKISELSELKMMLRVSKK